MCGRYSLAPDQSKEIADECWLDVTGSVGLFGEGSAIANDIRGRIRQELGLTVSIGVSFNKVFAKLAPILWNKGSFAPGVWPPHFRIGP